MSSLSLDTIQKAIPILINHCPDKTTLGPTVSVALITLKNSLNVKEENSSNHGIYVDPSCRNNTVVYQDPTNIEKNIVEIIRGLGTAQLIQMKKISHADPVVANYCKALIKKAILADKLVDLVAQISEKRAKPLSDRQIEILAKADAEFIGKQKRNIAGKINSYKLFYFLKNLQEEKIESLYKNEDEKKKLFVACSRIPNSTQLLKTYLSAHKDNDSILYAITESLLARNEYADAEVLASLIQKDSMKEYLFAKIENMQANTSKEELDLINIDDLSDDESVKELDDSSPTDIIEDLSPIRPVDQASIDDSIPSLNDSLFQSNDITDYSITSDSIIHDITNTSFGIENRNNHSGKENYTPPKTFANILF